MLFYEVEFGVLLRISCLLLSVNCLVCVARIEYHREKFIKKPWLGGLNVQQLRVDLWCGLHCCCVSVAEGDACVTAQGCLPLREPHNAANRLQPSQAHLILTTSQMPSYELRYEFGD